MVSTRERIIVTRATDSMHVCACVLWSSLAFFSVFIRYFIYFFLQESAPSETAALMIEPVLGEGGYVVPPPGFMEGVRDFCDRHDILMIADEVQSGEALYSLVNVMPPNSASPMSTHLTMSLTPRITAGQT